jgi:hypothetical protein
MVTLVLTALLICLLFAILRYVGPAGSEWRGAFEVEYVRQLERERAAAAKAQIDRERYAVERSLILAASEQLRRDQGRR